MASTRAEPDLVRRLSELRADRPVVLSLYLDLDPSEFATPPARRSGVRSLVDEAGRKIDAQDRSPEDRKALRAGLRRASAFLENELPTEGAHGVAVFVSEPLGVFESVTSPRSLPSRVAIARTPLVAPLALLSRGERWCVVLVNRERGRILTGDGSDLAELADVRDEVHGQHDQGGWSQARYQRSVDKEVEDHLRHVAEVVTRAYVRSPFDHLVIGCPHELLSYFRAELRTDVADLVAGELSVDVGTASMQDIVAAMRPLLEEHDDRLEREALDRLGASSTAAGSSAVLPALNERRVATLLIGDGWAEEGSACPACGWLGPGAAQRCPADGTSTEPVADLREPAVDLAILQDARVLPVRRHAERLRDAGNVAALLRF